MVMRSEHDDVDLIVVGGGVIGLSAAWKARLSGLSVMLLEREHLGAGASRVAAGMLAPVAETEFGPAGREVLNLGLRSAAMWPAFAAELEAASGVEVPIYQAGTLLIARDADAARALERQIALRDSLSLPTRRLRPSEARAREPALAPTVRLALEVPNDHSVDPRVVIDALGVACQRSGVDVREHCEVQAVATEQDGDGTERVSALLLSDGEQLRARRVLLALGAWTGEIGGLPDGERPEVRPVKGQILRLRDPAGPGLLRHVLRYEGGYIVPRGDGRYLLGATVEEQGFNPHPTAGGVHDLLREAWEVLPGISELEIEEIAVSFRPGSPDNVPLTGRGGVEGLVWATGHYRNGVLLAPITAELVMEALGDEVPA